MFLAGGWEVIYAWKDGSVPCLAVPGAWYIFVLESLITKYIIVALTLEWDLAIFECALSACFATTRNRRYQI